MAGQIYNWKRLWYPRKSHLALADSGFLPDPDERWGQYLNPEVVAFDRLRSYACLILLGEPGTGKTFALQAEFQNTKAAIEADGDQAIWLSLRSYGSEDRLCRDLFDSNEFSAWTRSTHRLYLFLDSLDEGLLSIPALSALLADQLCHLPVERLFIRIACRAAKWPAGLEATLGQLWQEDQREAFILAPLRRLDAIEAAKANNLSPDAFLAEVSRRNAAPLASRPVTLQQLLNIYHKDGVLPSTHADLYRRGCLLLCDEPNQNRRDAGRLGTLSMNQRLAVAARIAAITVFANRYAIWAGVDRGNVPDEDVTVHAISGGTENPDGDEFQVTADGVRETLGTGLFSVCGPERITWSHQTYAEFLASYYVLQRQMPLPQVRSLLVHPTDPSGRLVPQLHSVAAWVSGMSAEVFDDVLRRDPGVLLQSDLQAVDDSRRAALTASLLRAVDEGSLLDDDLGFNRLYAGLSHPTLDTRLRPYIMDRTRGLVVRRVAIDIAAATGQVALVSDLVNLALTPDEPITVRDSAAHAVRQIGDDNAKLRLRSLAFGKAGDDPDDELKAEALEALGPPT